MLRVWMSCEVRGHVKMRVCNLLCPDTTRFCLGRCCQGSAFQKIGSRAAGDIRQRPLSEHVPLGQRLVRECICLRVPCAFREYGEHFHYAASLSGSEGVAG